MKTKFLLLLASALVASSLTSCDVYATPYGGGYGYSRPSYYGGYNRGYRSPSYGYSGRYSGGYGGGYGGYNGRHCH